MLGEAEEMPCLIKESQLITVKIVRAREKSLLEHDSIITAGKIYQCSLKGLGRSLGKIGYAYSLKVSFSKYL